MVVLVSKDNKKSVNQHLHDLVYLLRINLTLFIIFSFLWAFFIEDNGSLSGPEGIVIPLPIN